MSFNDEKVIEELNSYKQGSYGNLESGFYIKEELFTFTKNYFFADKMSVMVPDKFIDMPDAMAKLKYPSEQRPPIIKTHPAGGIDFTFNLLDVPLKEEEVIIFRDNLKNVIRNTNPAVQFPEEGEFEVCGTKLGWFDFVTNVFDGMMYNIMYCMPVAGKMLHGIFNCNLAEKTVWGPVAEAVINSVVDETSSKAKGE